MAVGEKAVVADALKSRRYDVLQPTADELFGSQGEDLGFTAVTIVFVLEADVSVLGGAQATVGDGDVVNVSSEVFEDGIGPGERGFGIDDPLPAAQSLDPGGEVVRQGFQLAFELELLACVDGLQSVEEEVPEAATEHVYRQKEAAGTAAPVLSIGREATAGDQTVQVGMEMKILAPGVEHTEETGLGAEVLGIGSDGQESLRGGAKQDVIDDLLILQSEGGHLLGQSEDYVEIGDRQQLGLPLLEPFLTSLTLAFGAVPVAAGTVEDMSLLAMGAEFDHTTQRWSAAVFDGAHHLPVMVGQGMRLPVSGAVLPEDLRQLQGWRRAHRFTLWVAAFTGWCKRSSGLTVAATTLGVTAA